MRLALGVGLLGLARLGTATVAMARFGIAPFSVCFTLEGLALIAAAVALARGPDGRRAAAGAFVATGLLQTVPLLLSLPRGVTFLTLGDVLFIGGMLGASWAALQASTATRRARPAPEVGAHLAVAAAGPLLWTLTNAAMGRFDFTATSALALAGVSLSAWAFAREARDEAADAAPGVGA